MTKGRGWNDGNFSLVLDIPMAQTMKATHPVIAGLPRNLEVSA
jgi:hypothetical protein